MLIIWVPQRKPKPTTEEGKGEKRGDTMPVAILSPEEPTRATLFGLAWGGPWAQQPGL